MVNLINFKKGSVRMTTTTKGLKTRTRYSTTLPNKLVVELKEYSEQTMIPSTKIIESALIEYLKKHPVK